MRTTRKMAVAAGIALAASLPTMPVLAAPFKVGMALGGNAANDWQKAQGEVAGTMAKARGWDYVELSNNNDGATAVKNADVFIQDKVDAVIQFYQQPSVNPILAL